MTSYFEGKTATSDLPQTHIKHPCLIVVASPEPDDQGLHLVLLAHELMIGRGNQCAIRLNDRTVSRRHAL